ncbi:hypothetical protein [Vibrio parahaemolyticus]|uniref:hypothetical protein n=1 Tax=Vibrio parahaemolyticus TaxID=670 RepID=UPI0022EB1791|nr:hypothetical protein [Vibrio parahaemolyticus]EIU6824367.1 hypothetical protein [Vibrio parahaemolyticus]EIU6828008.1 hypothetical protein [Vibrio parahaemolyticus]
MAASKKAELKDTTNWGVWYQELSSAWGLGCEQFSIFPASQISMVKKGEVKKRVDFFALFLIRPNRWVFPTI